MTGEYGIEELYKLTLESLRLLAFFLGEEIEAQREYQINCRT